MKLRLLTLLFVLLVSNCFSQISPPGLGKANTAAWFALGVRQELDTIENNGWQSMSYIGWGRKSNPDNYNPFFKSAIFILNQEFYNQFQNDWQYSFALSYRRQEEYVDKPPYEHATPPLRQEFRLYGRLSYIFKSSRVKLIPTFRQEFRKFYGPDFENVGEDFQLRTRFRLQLTVNLDREKKHRLIASSEQLFSISKETKSDAWTEFNYRESRFSVYHSFSPRLLPLIFNVGYMNNLVGAEKPFDVHYLALDLIFVNPFGQP